MHGKIGQFQNMHIIPEFGVAENPERIQLIFHQMLDAHNSFTPHMASYALSLLCMEITQNYLNKVNLIWDGDPKGMDNNLKDNRSIMNTIAEWIKANSAEDLTVKLIAEHFNYNPDYLSTVFKKATGLSLNNYIHNVRIDNAKKMLLSTILSVKEISYLCGYKGEKQFISNFKKRENMTPTQYRNAYYKTRINTGSYGYIDE